LEKIAKTTEKIHKKKKLEEKKEKGRKKGWGQF
jgi:hypothetical protein